MLYFNSRLYMRGNLRARKVSLRKLNFNSRLYMRGNVVMSKEEVEQANFNSRLYMRGNGFTWQGMPLTYLFQFTPLHERQHG